MISPLRKAARIRNWNILRIRGAVGLLLAMNKLIPEPMLQIKNRVRLRGLQKALIAAIDADYQAFKQKVQNDKP